MPRIRTIIAALLALIALIPLAFVFQPSAAGAQQGGVMVDTLFGEGQSGLKVVFFVILVLVLLALAFWLLRRFGGRRLGSAATRGRQRRLGVIEQATVDGRRRLVLIRRDNVEHLLIVGGPTDVVVEQKIVRAAAPREAAPLRPPAAADTLPRAVPLGEDSMWPLQPEPASKVEPSPRVEPSLRAEPRAQRPPMAVEEPMLWPAEQPTEPEAPPAPLPSAPAARERNARTADPLARFAEELSRVPGAPEPAEQRRMPRLQTAPPPAGSTADAALKSLADQNLSEIALEAALRRPRKSNDTRMAPAAPKATGEPTPESGTFTPPPPSSPVPKTPSEATAPATDEVPADPTKGARGEGADAPQKSFYDSLEQEMASLLNRPPPKP